MEVGNWFGQHWFELFQSAGIVAGLLFTALTIRTEARARKVSNQLKITSQHQAIWTRLLDNPKLRRVLRKDVVAGGGRPISDEEEMFIAFLVLHFSSVYQAIQADMHTAPDGLAKDVREFFSLPIPKAVWERIKPLQDKEFVRFVEAIRHD